MIKIEAPDEHAARGVGLVLRAKLEFPDRPIGQRHFILYTTECGLWAVWRVKTGWVARWLRYADGK